MAGQGLLIWVHVADMPYLAAFKDIFARLNLIEPNIKAHITASPDMGGAVSDVVTVDYSNPKELQDKVFDRKPDLCIWAESDIHTDVLVLCNKEDLPVILADVRSDTLAKRSWFWRKSILRPALRPIAAALVQSDDDAVFLYSHGLQEGRAEISGPLHPGVIPLRCDISERDQIGAVLAGRPVWYCRNIPREEIDIILAAYSKAQRRAHKLLLILDLHDMDLQAEVMHKLAQQGLIVHQRAQEGVPEERTQVFMSDSENEDGLWYRLAGFSYLGGSLTGAAPTADPLAAAALGSAVVHGMQYGQYEHNFTRLRSAGATLAVADSSMLAQNIVKITSADICAQIAHAGWDVISQSANFTDRLVEYILDYGDERA